ncbi:hypothetical protein [Sulfurimonas sp.]|uniref:hypothetical protein n=1 Tax=Sulfurimonas sp. TaxID=2022749 RepID=UPI002B47ABFF|nr:hypothetical protein [Sulfurimonas sp.]
MDEMRFGLISNYRRSWSKIGKRTVIANQLLQKYFLKHSLKSTANRLFKDIEIQKDIIEDEVVIWMANTAKTQKLCGYEWIIEQAKLFIF